jgi:hypothetical protein
MPVRGLRGACIEGLALAVGGALGGREAEVLLGSLSLKGLYY